MGPKQCSCYLQCCEGGEIAEYSAPQGGEGVLLEVAKRVAREENGGAERSHVRQT